jgi:hypothetical protein
VKVVQFDDLFIHAELEDAEIRVAMPFMDYHRVVGGEGFYGRDDLYVWIFFVLRPEFGQFCRRTI